MNTQVAPAPYSTKCDVAKTPLVWNPDICIQCNKCISVCPRAAIRAYIFDPEDPGHAFAARKSAKAPEAQHKRQRYMIQVAPGECTCCGVCVEVCPVRNEKDGRLKAISMRTTGTVRRGAPESRRFFLDSSGSEDRQPQRDAQRVLMSPSNRVGEFTGARKAGSETLATLFGVPVNALSNDQVLSIVDRVIECRGRLLIGVVNAAKMVNMRRDDPLRRAVLSSDMILADGMAVVWAARLLRQHLPERVAGIDLMHHILRRGQERRYRVYLLGATDDVLRASTARIEADYPDLVLVGTRNGYFDPDEEPRIVSAIRAAQADVLFVAMSPPRKELFMARWFAELNVPVCHGVGGALDVLAGKVRRAPQHWQRLGLEWLYRVKQEPRRMWRRYLVTNTLFCGMVLREFCSAAQTAPEKSGTSGALLPGTRASVQGKRK